MFRVVVRRFSEKAPSSAAARTALHDEKMRNRKRIMSHLVQQSKLQQQQRETQETAKPSSLSSSSTAGGRVGGSSAIGGSQAGGQSDINNLESKKLSAQARQEAHRLRILQHKERLEEQRRQTAKLRQLKQQTMERAQAEFLVALEETADLWDVHPNEAEFRAYNIHEPERFGEKLDDH